MKNLATLFTEREDRETKLVKVEKEKVIQIEPKKETASMTVMMVNTANLLSNTKYQRDLDRKKVEMIVNNFDPHRLGVIKVSFRDGKYYVFDGQHRLMAIKAINKGKDCNIPCEIHYGLTYEDEAKLFAMQYDGTTKVDVVYQNRALYEAKDHTTVKLKNLVEASGLTINFTKSKANNNIVAVSKLRSMFKELNDTELVKVLCMIKNTWDGVATSLDKDILGGVFLFYKTYKDELQENIFIKNLGKLDPIYIKRVGKSDYSARGDIKYAKVIWDAYNDHLSKNKLEYKFKG